MGVPRRDDAVDAFLTDRRWWSRRRHGRENGYVARYDAWGWGGDAPGGISITCIGEGSFEIGWMSSHTRQPIVEVVVGRTQVIARAVTFEAFRDFIPHMSVLHPAVLVDYVTS